MYCTLYSTYSAGIYFFASQALLYVVVDSAKSEIQQVFSGQRGVAISSYIEQQTDTSAVK